MPATIFDEQEHDEEATISITMKELGDPLQTYWGAFLGSTAQLSAESQQSLSAHIAHVSSLLTKYKFEVVDVLPKPSKAPNAKMAHASSDVDSRVHDHPLGLGIVSRGIREGHMEVGRSKNRLSLTASHEDQNLEGGAVADLKTEAVAEHDSLRDQSRPSTRPATVPSKRQGSPSAGGQLDSTEARKALFDAYDHEYHQNFLKIYRFKRLELHLASLLVKRTGKSLLLGDADAKLQANTDLSTFRSPSKHRNALSPNSRSPSKLGRPATSPQRAPPKPSDKFTELLRSLTSADELSAGRITLPSSLCEATISTDGVAQSPNKMTDMKDVPTINEADPIAKQILDSHLEVHAKDYLNYLRKLVRIDLLKTLTLLRRKQADMEVEQARLSGSGQGAMAAKINNTSVSSKLALQAAMLATSIAKELSSAHLLPELLLNQGAVQLSLKQYPDALSTGVEAHEIVTNIMQSLRVTLDHAEETDGRQDSSFTSERANGVTQKELALAECLTNYTSVSADTLDGYHLWRSYIKELRQQAEGTSHCVDPEEDKPYNDSFAARRQSTATASPQEADLAKASAEVSRSAIVEDASYTSASEPKTRVTSAKVIAEAHSFHQPQDRSLSFEVAIERDEEGNVCPMQYLLWAHGSSKNHAKSPHHRQNKLRISQISKNNDPNISAVSATSYKNETNASSVEAVSYLSPIRAKHAHGPAAESSNATFPVLMMILEEERKFNSNLRPDSPSTEDMVTLSRAHQFHNESAVKHNSASANKQLRASRKEALRAWGGVLALVYRHIGVAMRFTGDFESAFRTLEVSHVTAMQFLSETDSIAVLCKAAFEEAKTEFDQQNRIHHAPNVITKPRHYFDKSSPFPKSYLSGAIPQIPQKRRVLRPEWNQSFVSGIPPSAAIAQKQRAEDAEAVDSYQRHKRRQAGLDTSDDEFETSNRSDRVNRIGDNYKLSSEALKDQFRRSRAQIGINIYNSSSPFAGGGEDGVYALSSPLSKGMMRRSPTKQEADTRPSTAATPPMTRSKLGTPMRKGGRLPPLPGHHDQSLSFEEDGMEEPLTAADYAYMRQVYRLPWDPKSSFVTQTRFGSAANDATACWRDGTKRRPTTAVVKLLEAEESKSRTPKM